MRLWKRSTRGLWGPQGPRVEAVHRGPSASVGCGLCKPAGAARSVGTDAKPLKTPLLYFGLRIAAAGTANAVTPGWRHGAKSLISLGLT